MTKKNYKTQTSWMDQADNASRKHQSLIKVVRRLSDGKNIYFSLYLEDRSGIPVFQDRILESKNECLHQENRENKTVKEKKDESVIVMKTKHP